MIPQMAAAMRRALRTLTSEQICFTCTGQADTLVLLMCYTESHNKLLASLLRLKPRQPMHAIHIY